jgi:hypothetical protein
MISAMAFREWDCPRARAGRGHRRGVGSQDRRDDGDAQHDAPRVQARVEGGEKLATGGERGDGERDQRDRKAHHARSGGGAAVGRAQQVADPEAVQGVGRHHPGGEDEPQRAGEQPPGEVRARHREEHRLADGVERERECSAHGRDEHRVLSAREAREHAALDAHRMHHLPARRAHHRGEVRGAEEREEADGDPHAGVLEPFRRLPFGGDGGDQHRDDRHDHAVARGKEQPRPARDARAAVRVEAREAVDGREVIGIEAVLEAEEEDDRGERQPMRGQRFHGPISG